MGMKELLKRHSEDPLQHLKKAPCIWNIETLHNQLMQLNEVDWVYVSFKENMATLWKNTISPIEHFKRVILHSKHNFRIQFSTCKACRNNSKDVNPWKNENLAGEVVVSVGDRWDSQALRQSFEILVSF